MKRKLKHTLGDVQAPPEDFLSAFGLSTTAAALTSNTESLRKDSRKMFRTSTNSRMITYKKPAVEDLIGLEKFNFGSNKRTAYSVSFTEALSMGMISREDKAKDPRVATKYRSHRPAMHRRVRSVASR